MNDLPTPSATNHNPNHLANHAAPMIVIGLLGGIGSGKSTVAAAFERCGAASIDADGLAHEVLALPETVDRLREAFGSDVLAVDGGIDRSKLAGRVFGSGEEGQLERLERLVHPILWRMVIARIEEARRSGSAAVVLDAPLLLEAGWDVLCDELVWVETSSTARRERIATRGWTPAQLEARERKQWPLDQKAARATHIVPNDATIEGLEGHVRRLWDQSVGNLGQRLDFQG
jgi:dephospho-CoA kinase